MRVADGNKAATLISQCSDSLENREACTKHRNVPNASYEEIV